MIDRSFATETSAMRTLPFSSQVDWSFRIGLSLVVLFGAAQIFSVGYYYLGRTRSAQTTVQPSIATTRPSPSVLPTAAPAATAAAVAASPSPSTSTLSAADRLLKEATTLRERGDTTNALARLQEATQRDPKNANVLKEMATIYESREQFDRSNETWRKVEEIGPSAGSVYETAMLKLKKSAAATPAPSAAAEASPTETTVARASADGIPEGSTFGIAEITASETPDSDAETNLMLRLGVKKRANSVVDHTKVKIQVFFYDTVDDKDIKLTDAEVNYEWLTPNHDWAGASPEVLAVTYVRPKNKARSQEEALSAAAAAIIPGKKARPKPASPDDSGRRRYLGYIVRVYYNDKLQAVRADPTKLLNLFPPPNTASSP
jgi:tetratricopeptide (TPR) repeat protein